MKAANAHSHAAHRAVLPAGVVDGGARAWDRWGRAAWSAVGVGLAVAGGFWLTMRLMPIVVAVVVAVLLATLLWPAVRWLEARSVPGLVATWSVLLGVVAVLSVVSAWLISTIGGEAGAVRASAGGGLTKVEDWLVSGPFGLDRTRVDRWDASLRDQFESFQHHVASGALAKAPLALEVVGGVLLTAVLLFYVLRLASADATALEPIAGRDPRLVEVWASLSGFSRGVVVNATINAVVLGVTLWVLRIPLAGPIAAITFLASFVPIVGAIVSGILAALIALVEVGPLSAVVVVGATVAIHHLEGYVIGPRVIGRRTGLHPLALILAVAVGLKLAGVAGAFLAGPTLAVAAGLVRGRTSDDGR
jgi:predicted PurR-regulated permease PerM